MKKYLTNPKTWNITCTVLLFCLLFLFGLCSFQDYGLAGDAYEERRTCLVNYKYLFPSVADIQTDTVNFSEIADLSEYADRYYGVALQLPTVFVEHFFDFNLTYNQIFQMRHLYTFLLFFAGCIFFFLLARMLTGSTAAACVGTAMFILSPRILADSMYNIKDIPFLSIFIVNLYVGLRFLRKPGPLSAALLGIVSAVCTNTRIIGGIAVFACLLAFLCDRTRWQRFSRALGLCLLCGIVCFVTYVAITPVTWSGPISAIIGTLRTFSSFDVYTFTNYFMGELIDGSQLPWYYLPVWIGLTTPLLYLILFGVGTAGTAVGIVRRRGSLSSYTERLFLFATAAVPLLYVFIASPVLYNGWRHFYFIYSVLILFALLGFQYLARLLAGRKVFLLYGATGLYLLSIVLWIGRNHPNEVVYFNYPSRSYANANMDKDYWNVEAASAVEKLLALSDSESFSVVFYPHSWYSQGIFSAADQARVQSVSRYYPQSADYYLYTYLENPATEEFYGYYYFDELSAGEASGIKFNAIFSRSYRLTSISNLKLSPASDTLLYGTEEISWTADRNSSGSYTLTASLEQTAQTDRLYFSCLNTAVDIEEIQITDIQGNTQAASVHYLESDVNSGYWIFFDRCQPASVSIRLSFSSEQDSYRMLFHLTEPVTEENGGVSVQSLASLSAGINWTEAANAADGSLNTSWHAGSQEPGTQVQLELDQEKTVSGFSLETGGKDWDSPHDLIIETSPDGENWIPVEYTSPNNIDFLFSPVSCRYIRLTIGEHSEEISSEWTIAEIFLYTSAAGIEENG